MHLLLAILAISVTVVTCELQLTIPLIDQLPQIAHVGSPYNWTINPNTFTDSAAPSTPLSLTYNASGLPAWAQFDAITQTFSGSPASSDEGGSRITVTASANDTTSETSSFTLLVLDEPAPTLNLPIAQQLPTASSLGSKSLLPGNILYIPLGWSFSVGLEGDTFTLANGDEVYMSVSINGSTVLPSWITWSADTYTLYGVAPTEPISDGGQLDFIVTGSNRPEFGGTSDTLKIQISAHSFSLNGTLRSVNASVGDTFTYQLPTTAIELDGKQNNNTVNPVTILPDLATTPWITFDNSTNTLSGAPPFDQFQDANVTQMSLVPLVFSDTLGNSLAANLTVNISPFAFTEQTLPNVYIEPGKAVNVSLGEYVRMSSNSTSLVVEQSLVASDAFSGATFNATFDPVNASSWLDFDTESLLLTGTVPSQESGRVKVDLESTNALNQTSSAYFYLTTVKSDMTPSSGGTSGTSSHNSGSSGLSQNARIALAGSLGGVGGFALLLLMIICCRRHVAKEEHDFNGYVHGGDDDDRTLNETSPQRNYKKAIVLRKGGEGMTPSTIATGSPYVEKGEKQGEASTSSPLAFKGVLVEDWSGDQRENSGEEPMQSRMMTGLFGGKGKPEGNGAKVAFAGVGLGLGLDQRDDPYTTPNPRLAAASESQERMRQFRSQQSVQSHRSSWESDLFYDNREGAATSNHNGFTAPISDEDLPRRRGGQQNIAAAPAITTTSLSVRHRTTHSKESPSFHAPGVFPPSDEAVKAGDSGDMSTVEDEDYFGDSRTGLGAARGAEDVQIMKAKVMQVRQHSPLIANNNNPFSQAMGRKAEAMYDSYNGIFDDAEDEGEMEEIGLGDQDPIRRRDGTTKDRASVFSTMTDSSQMQAMRAHFANGERVASEAQLASRHPETFSPNPSFMDGASLSEYEPQETMKAIRSRARTPPPHASSTARSHHIASTRYMLCPDVIAMVDCPVRFHIYPIVPPPMAGAPGSPGKRSGDTKRYSLVLDDIRPHLSPYRMMWPDMFGDWLKFDETTFEAFGFVPEFAGLEELGDVEIALVQTNKAARISPSPIINGSPIKQDSSNKRNSIMSIDSAHTFVAAAADDDFTIVARARLIFQSKIPLAY
ncbi:hypothetical protein CBS101457_000894 [Exobasidium rhododendri]|nr:hypothetical protein CBS101457_000894 [Exobasidium rhododendri]